MNLFMEVSSQCKFISGGFIPEGFVPLQVRTMDVSSHVYKYVHRKINDLAKQHCIVINFCRVSTVFTNIIIFKKTY